MKLITTALLGLALFAGTASAAVIIDQNNPTVSNGFCHTNGTNLCGQSFKQDHDNIAGAGVHINPDWYVGAGTLTISIYSAYSNNLSNADLIAQGTSGTINSSSGWVDVFWSAAAISADTTYYMVLSSTQNYMVASYSNFGSYADGNALHGGNATGWSSYDLSFRTYYDDGFSNAVPVPGSLALLGLGLAGLGFARRRRA